MKYIVFAKVVKGELSPFDEAALECALRLREVSPGELILASMAPESAADALRALTRLGIDRTVLLTDPAFAGSDTACTSLVLAQAAKGFLGIEREYLILCGRQSMDGDTAQVGVSVAARLGIPAHTNVMAFDGAGCTTRMGGEELKLPALVTVERIAVLRRPSMRARPRDIERMDARTLGIDKERVGLRGSPTRVLRSFESDRGRRFCKFLTPDALAEKLAELMHTPRAAAETEESEAKLPEIFAVGEDVAAIAGRIAHHVTVLPRMSADEYVSMFRDDPPEVLLFPADLWGRRTAPEVATRLAAGLCADCTRLETDGTRLQMYRPALGGRVTAMIECRTKPQMATVRTVSESADVIVSCGFGVRGGIAAAQTLADRLGAQMGASRKLVDGGFAPYEQQVGITGRTVAPKIYLALGISGAVHHTAAIEGSGFILAVNPDKNAQIFDFCDFGCVSDAEAFFHAAESAKF
ncbi:MAG: hypothetical protein E7632_04895 [Ruminococcaceae bacterium]|nr:hypothetical protein [Oscillospiraceae bacterium]